MNPPAKTTVEDCLTLDIHVLKRAGLLEFGRRAQLRFERPGRESDSLGMSMWWDSLDLEYTVVSASGTKTPVNYQVTVVRTPAINEGERVWFSCPGCHKPVSKLYRPKGKNAFLCRTCHHLTYASRQSRRPNIWRQVNQEMPGLLEEVLDPKLSRRRRKKAADRIEKLRARVEGAATTNLNLLPPAIRPLFRDILAHGIDGGLEQLLHPNTPPSPPPKRPRGRPRERRDYQRRRPFHQSERRSATEAFCVKCRAYCEPVERELVSFKNGRPAVQGRCPICGSKVARIISGAEAAALAGDEEKPPQTGRRPV